MKFDEKGNVSIEINPNGQDPALMQLDEFFNGYLRSLDEEDRNKTLEMMHLILQRVFHAKQYSIVDNAGYYIWLLCMSEYSENAAELLAYLVKYEYLHPEFGDKFMNLIRSLDAGFLKEFIAGHIKNGLKISPVFPVYAYILEPLNKAFGNIYGNLGDVIIGFLKLYREKLKSVKINENGADIWIGPLIPKMTRTSLTSEKSEVVHEQEDGYRGCYFWCDLSGMRIEADNLIRYSKKYEQIITEVEGHANNLAISSSASDAIRQSLLSVAARMRAEKEKLNELGKLLHTITNMYEAADNSVVENAQWNRPVSHNPAVGLTGKLQLTERI